MRQYWEHERLGGGTGVVPVLTAARVYLAVHMTM